jgi:hypothetical protein
LGPNPTENLETWMFCERAAKKCPHSCTKMMDASTATASSDDAGPSSWKLVPNTPAPPNARPAGSRRRIAGETSKASAKGAEVETSASSTSDPARDVDEARSEGAVLSGRSTAASPLLDRGEARREGGVPPPAAGNRRPGSRRGGAGDARASDRDNCRRSASRRGGASSRGDRERTRRRRHRRRRRHHRHRRGRVFGRRRAVLCPTSGGEGEGTFDIVGARRRAKTTRAPLCHSREISQLRGRQCANPEFEFLSG